MKAWLEATKGENLASKSPHAKSRFGMAEGEQGGNTLKPIIQPVEKSTGHNSPLTTSTTIKEKASSYA
jgi:hypothetical protein